MQSTPTQVSTVDKRAQRVRAMFGGIARHYDLLNHLLSANIDRRWRRFTVRTVPASARDRILDVCTGTGDLALGYAAGQEAGGMVVGVDFCHEMLVLAREKCRRRSAAVQLLEADALQLPFGDETFTLVTIAFGLRNLADTRQGIAELIRVTEPGGRVAILEFSRPRAPILAQIYLAYFRYLLPWLGQLISRSEHAAYHYLAQSVLEFPDGQEMVELLGAMGLREVSRYPRTLGIATLYVGQKPVSRVGDN